MRQVGARAVASPIIIDPRRGGPMAKPRRNPGPLAMLNRVWVLHRPLFIRGFAGVACAALIALSFQARGGISQAVVTMSEVMQGEFAAAGLGIGEISITGQAVTREADIVKALAIEPDTSILSFDVEAARQRLTALPAVTDATVRKVYPDQLTVTLAEKEPVARWRTGDGQTFIIDAAGSRIGTALPLDDKLPLVIGDGAADDASVIIRALQRYPDIYVGLAAVSRLADRRWDLIYKSGLRVQLPETGIAQALATLDGYQRDYRLLDRDLSQVDLRVSGMLVVRPVETAPEDDKAAS